MMKFVDYIMDLYNCEQNILLDRVQECRTIIIDDDMRSENTRRWECQCDNKPATVVETRSLTVRVYTTIT